MPYDKIDVVVHPQSIVHSMVEFRDGAVMAQLGMPDMRLPIQYALTYPARIASDFSRLDFSRLGALTFTAPDTETFRGLTIAVEAGRVGGTAPCVMNAANEVAVEAFLGGFIGFLDIYRIMEETSTARPVRQTVTFETLQEEDAWARRYARQRIAARQ